MPTNGTLKYKQDDGSIVELNPAGVVTQTTYNEGQAAQDAKITALENDKADKSAIPDVSALVTKATYDAGQATQDAKITALENDKADKSAIPDVSALVTKATYDAGQATQDAKITALENVAPDKLPYSFDRITISSLMYSATTIHYAVAYLDLPWLHSQSHQLTAHLSGVAPFYVVNLRDGSVQTVTPDSITIVAVCSDSSPYHVNILMQLPASITENTPYLVTATSSFISIE